MRILIGARHQSMVGGTEKYLRSILPALHARGHDIALLFEYPEKSGLPTVDSSSSPTLTWSSEELAQTDGRAALERWNADVIYLHGLESPDLERYLADAYPTVLFAHGYFGTCTTGHKCHAFPEVQSCSRRFGVACLLLHYPRRCGGLNPVRAIQMFRGESKRNSTLHKYRKIAVASRHMYEEYICNGLNPTQLCLLHLPVTDILPLDSPPVPHPVRGNLLMVGRLTDLKGCDYLIRALPMASDLLGRELTLTVAGSGSESAGLERLARSLGVKAHFAGWVDATRQQELVVGADLLIVPSLWPEPFGLVGIEAGCLGLPAVGFAVGGIPEWLLPGVNGELAPSDPPTPEGLADGIFRALHDKAHYDALCLGAWEVAKRFNLEGHLRQLEALLESAICGSPAKADLVVEEGRA